MNISTILEKDNSDMLIQDRYDIHREAIKALDNKIESFNAYDYVYDAIGELREEVHQELSALSDRMNEYDTKLNQLLGQTHQHTREVKAEVLTEINKQNNLLCHQLDAVKKTQESICIISKDIQENSKVQLETIKAATKFEPWSWIVGGLLIGLALFLP